MKYWIAGCLCLSLNAPHPAWADTIYVTLEKDNALAVLDTTTHQLP